MSLKTVQKSRISIAVWCLLDKDKVLRRKQWLERLANLAILPMDSDNLSLSGRSL